MSTTGESRSAPGAVGAGSLSAGMVNRSGIVTPDAVGLDLDVATLGSRGAAYLLDLLIFGSVLVVLVVGQALLGFDGFVPGWFGIALLLLLAFTWQFGYPIGFEVLSRGRTPGKMALGLRVVTVEGAPVGLRHATIRAIVGLLELTGSTGTIAVVSSFASPRSQRLGDMAAGTLVVRERRGGGMPSAESFVPPAGLEGYVARLDVTGIGTEDYAAIRETLRRARELPADIRTPLSSELARRIVGRVRPAPPGDVSAEAFLTAVAAAVQARRSPTPATSGSRAVTPPGPPPPAGDPVAPSPAAPGPPTRPDDGPPAPPARPARGFLPPE